MTQRFATTINLCSTHSVCFVSWSNREGGEMSISEIANIGFLIKSLFNAQIYTKPTQLIS